MEALRVGTARQSCNKEQMPGASYKSGQRLESTTGGIWSTLLAGQAAHPLLLLIDNPRSETYRPPR